MVLEEEYIRCQSQKQEQLQPMRSIRSSLYRVSAGTGVLLDDDAWEEIQVPDTEEAQKADFALRIAGDSMEPIYHDGDIVLVRKNRYLASWRDRYFFCKWKRLHQEIWWRSPDFLE